MSMNLGMMASYDEIKEYFNKGAEEENSVPIRLKSSAVSGVICSFMSLPFDNMKTKLMKMVKNE